MRGTGGGVSLNMGTELGRPLGVRGDGAGMPVGGMPSSLTPMLERRGVRRILPSEGAGADACAALTLLFRLVPLTPLAALVLLRADAALMLDAALAALAALATDVADVDCAIGRPPGGYPRPSERGPLPCEPRVSGRSAGHSVRS